MQKIVIGKNEANQRLDRFLRKYLKDLSLSEIYSIIRKKKVKVNGRASKENYKLSEGDELTLYFDHKENDEGLKPTGKDFSVIYEDQNILIADKPPGLILHPDSRHKENTLVDQVLYYLYKKGEYNPNGENTFRPSAANRLDVNTGGIVLFAKNYASLQDLNVMIRDRMINKFYICVVFGKIVKEMDLVAYIIKDETKNKSIISDEEVEGSKKIHTRIFPIKDCGSYTLLKVELITGRSHQIRAQLSSIGHPIIGDIKYGILNENILFKEKYGLNSQLLYAYNIAFLKAYGKLIYLKGREFSSNLPKTYKTIIKQLFDYDLT